MSYKSVLVHVENDAATENRVKCAADIADRFGALLIGCGCEAPQVPVAGDAFGISSGEVTVFERERVDGNLAAAKATFERLAAGRRHAWIAEQRLPEEGLAEVSRACDLIVTSRASRGRGDPLQHEDIGLLIVTAGRPVLLAPRDKDYLPPSRVLVCWKDSRESRRAISDALPFLQAASEVLVVEVADQNDLGAACKRTADVAEALKRHGVPAVGEGVIQDERSTGAIIAHRADCMGADLIVAGGYGRARLSEWVFGGVTRALLEQERRFVLLSH